MPAMIEPAPLPDPAPPVATPKPEPAPAPEVNEPPAQEPTPKPATPVRSRTRDTLKKIGRIAIPLIIGAAIVKNNRDHGNRDQDDKQADRRIEVSPRSLTVRAPSNQYDRYVATEGPSVVTVTNVGRDPVNIQSIGFEGDGASLFVQQNDCEGRSLAPKQQCRVRIGMTQSSSGFRVKLVVNSDGGRGSVDVISPEVNSKP